MQNKEEILHLVEYYINLFKEGKEESKLLMQFLNKYDGEDLINRKNFDAHITASAFIINEDADALLLLRHKSLDRWLQPGGHVDASDASLIASALREAFEETGLASNDLLVLSSSIFDINSHHIPANSKKHEPAHIHHDVRFLFQSSRSSLNISLEESTDSKWLSFSDLKNNNDFNWFEEKLRMTFR